MSPITITPVNKLNLRTKYGILSQYAQKIIKSQVKSISYDLETFFSEINSKLIPENELKLKEIGIKQIGKDVNEGILISGDKYDCHVFLTEDDYLNFNIYKPDCNDVYRHFSIKNKSNEYRHAGNFSGLNTEDELSEVIEFVDDKLYKAKRVFKQVNIQQPFIQTQETSDKITELNRVLCRTKKPFVTGDIGYISLEEEKFVDSIIEKLRITQQLYKKIPDCRTKYEVRSSYNNYMPQPVTNKLGFKNIGPSGESICLFDSSFKNNAHTVIIVTDVNGNEIKFVISKDNKSVQKNLPSRCVKSENSGYRIYFPPNYYTQKEIDESNLSSYLFCLDKEMDLFIEHTQNWFKKREETKLIRSNYDTANLEQYSELLDDIYSNFESYRTKMRKYLRKTNKSRKFKVENNISTKLTSTAVKFDSITLDGNDLRLSFPKVKSSLATQLLVMRGDEIIDSFYILNNKLLRFKISDLTFKFNHYNQHLYYYDNKYLQNSNLYEYLLLLSDKLHSLNEKLDALRVRQIENRIKHNIKSPKEQ